MSPARELAAGATGPRAQQASRELANTIRERRYSRAAGSLTANERRAVYLLDAGRIEQYAAEFPRGVTP